MAVPTNLLSLIVIGICCSGAVQGGGDTFNKIDQCTKDGIKKSYMLYLITVVSNAKEYIYYVPKEKETKKVINWDTRDSATSIIDCANEANTADAAMFRFAEKKCTTSSDSYIGSCGGPRASLVEADPDLGVYTLKECTAATAAAAEAAAEAASSLITPGGVIIAGGYNGGGSYSSDVETIDTPCLPSLPHKVKLLTLSLVRAKLFVCGGQEKDNGAIDRCYSLDTSESSPTWTQLGNNIPAKIYEHSASVIGDHIWLTHNDHLYDLNTITGNFETHDLPFDASSGSCAVSTGTHIYHTGAGSNKDEIWMNTEASKSEKWHKVATMSKKRDKHGCLYLNNKVYITGGVVNTAGVEVVNAADGEVLDTNTNTMSDIGPLIAGRVRHGMMIINDSPAVVAGWTGSGLTGNVEIYNVEAGKWEADSRTVKIPKESFGLAQRLIE